MKKLLFLLAAGLLLATGSRAQSDFRPILKATFTAFDTTYSNLTEKAALGNKLLLIAKKYPNDFAPNYYAAYSRVQLSYMEQDEAKREAMVDEAETYYAEAVHALGKENDETHVLAAMVANARMAVKPRDRYAKYGKIFNDQLDSAKAINPDNPRVYLQRGISKFYTPKMFGGGKKAAKPYFEKAKSLFDKQPAEDITQPYWGAVANNYFLSQIKGDSDE